MQDKKFSQGKTYPLHIMKRLLDTPQLLPDENPQEFIQLFESFEEYGKPQSPRDYLAVYQATVLTWDILRYQRMKIGVMRSHRRPAVESLLSKTHVYAMATSAAFVKSEAHKDATRWFAEPASRATLMKEIEQAGYPAEALEVEAFQLALPALAKIEGLIVSAQKRLDLFLFELERTAKASARALRQAAEKAIAANATGQPQAPTK